MLKAPVGLRLLENWGKGLQEVIWWQRTWNSMGVRRTALMEAGILFNESHLLNPLGTRGQRRELGVKVADTEQQAQSSAIDARGVGGVQMGSPRSRNWPRNLRWSVEFSSPPTPTFSGIPRGIRR